jgi:hypothetical protein
MSQTAPLGETRYIFRSLFTEPKGKRPLGRPMSYVLCLYRGGFPHAPRPYMVY